ncbi:uncharacterized protein LOC118786187 [Megalops cyprinoides]|uniref:uncharacterized protein LOC118786187 n=1 Tax=Megalops cyprinoides TaxID=118141 RepID=UPI00186524C0|nr:uncharacterized protein LOC118786187 [Megalops cyprinoides]
MVGQCCCIKNCHSRSHHRSGRKLNNGIRFFAFPTWKKHEGKQVEEVTRRRRMAWVAAVRRKDFTFNSIPASMKVCSLHFQSGKPAYEMLECHPDWVPSLHLGHTEVRATHTDRFNRRAKRRQALTGSNTVPATPPDLAGQRSGMDEAAPPVLNLKGRAGKGDMTAVSDKGSSMPNDGGGGDANTEKQTLPRNKRKRAYKVMLEEETIVGEALKGSSQPEKKKLDIEGRYPQGSWEQATVEAIMNLKTSDTTTTTSQIAQTIIANLKDENDFLRAQNIKLQWELRSVQERLEAELQVTKEELRSLKQKCTCIEKHVKNNINGDPSSGVSLLTNAETLLVVDSASQAKKYAGVSENGKDNSTDTDGVDY